MNIKDFLNDNAIYIVFICVALLLIYISNYNYITPEVLPVIENMVGDDLATENANLKLLAKYLTLIIRKSEAQKELYTIETGKRQVYNSPTLVQLNRQITVFKEKIRSNPSALKYFNENLNITL